MPSRHLSPDARRFLADHVHSVLQLELVLLLAADPARAWTGDDAARELRAPAPWTSARLAELAALGVLVADGGRHRHAAGGRWATAVDEVAAQYRRRRTSVIAMIAATLQDGRSAR